MNGRSSRFNTAALFPSILTTAALLTLPTSSAQGGVRAEGTLNLRGIQGRVEMQDKGNMWRSLDSHAINSPLDQGLRTGTGRAVLTNRSGGRLLVGSASRLRLYSNETDLQAGQFLLEGPSAAFALGSHMVMEGAGRARVDLSPDGSTQRIALLQGSLRVSNGARQLILQAGQQLSLQSWQVSSFEEEDAWYASMFTGSGAATVEALRGQVRWFVSEGNPQTAKIGLPLNESQTLTTGEASWAEIGFTGGGYLRLTEQSELKVLAVEKTARGREVTLQLVRGSAWNVVEKGQGGYKISTPVVSTAVRGTKFRVDANGLVKVMEGTVSLPSSLGVNVSAGQQKAAKEPIVPLQKDALDRLNESLDAERSRDMQLEVAPFARWQTRLGMQASGLPDTVLSAIAIYRTGRRYNLTVDGDSSGGKFKLSQANLPEGRYTLQITAKRFQQVRVWSGTVWVDHTPPLLSNVSRMAAGQVSVLMGTASDSAGSVLTLRIRGQQGDVVRHVHGNFKVLLPPRLAGSPLTLTLTDAAGNSDHALVP